MAEGLRTLAEIDVLEDEALRTRLVWESVLTLVAALVAALGAAFFTRTPILATPSAWGAAAAALVLSFVAHELVHGLAFRLMAGRGCRIRFGAEAGMLYTRAEGVRLAPGRFVCVLLAPTVAVTAALLLGSCAGFAAELWIVCAIHLSGCVGDWEMAREIARTPGVVAVEDTDAGCRLLGDV